MLSIGLQGGSVMIIDEVFAQERQMVSENGAHASQIPLIASVSFADNKYATPKQTNSGRTCPLCGFRPLPARKISFVNPMLMLKESGTDDRWRVACFGSNKFSFVNEAFQAGLTV
jgi:hypothetical protein